MQKLFAMMLLGLSVVSADENAKLVSDEFGFYDNEIKTVLETLNGKEEKCPEIKSAKKDLEKKVEFYAKKAKVHNEKMKDFEAQKEELAQSQDKALKNAQNEQEKKNAENNHQVSLDALEKKIADYQKAREDDRNADRESIQHSIDNAKNVACKKQIEDTGYGKKDAKGNELPYDLINRALTENREKDFHNRNFVASALNYKDRLDLCQKDLRRLEGFLNTKGNEKLRYFVATKELTTSMKSNMNAAVGDGSDFQQKYMGMEAALRAEHEQCANVKRHIADKVIDYYINGSDAKGTGKQWDQKNSRIKDSVKAKIDELDGMMRLFGDGSVFNRSDVKLTFDVKRSGQDLDALIKVFKLDKNKKYTLNPKDIKKISSGMIDEVKNIVTHIKNDSSNGETKTFNDRIETLLRCFDEGVAGGPVVKEMAEIGMNNDFRTLLQDTLAKIKAGK